MYFENNGGINQGRAVETAPVNMLKSGQYESEWSIEILNGRFWWWIEILNLVRFYVLYIEKRLFHLGQKVVRFMYSTDC